VTLRPPVVGLALAEELRIVALAQAGDERAFAELVYRRQSSIRNLLRRLSRDEALADDLAQETFLHAWRKLSRLRAHGAFGSWLRQIAVSIWLQHIRGNTAFTELDESSARDPSVSRTSVALDLDCALAGLAPEARLCVVLSYHEGMSHGEIAVATGLPLGTIKSHILRGTKQLRALLNAYEGTEP
jgi:RNA polymerase sigma-70 factor (ECF subfamily)